MWIWQLEKSEGGDVDAIAARAAAAGGLAPSSSRLGDGADAVGPVHPAARRRAAPARAEGLRLAVRLRQQPERRGAPSPRPRSPTGADCFVIDAESQYEGKYAAAQTYMTALRAAAGPSYPDRPDLVPLRRLPPGPAVLGLPRPGRRAGQPAAGLLEGHRRDRRRDQRPHARPQPHLRRADRAARARPTTTRRPPTCGASASSGRPTARRACRGGAGRRPTPRTGTSSSEPAPAARVEPDPGWPALGKGAKGDEVVWLQEHLTQTYPDRHGDGQVRHARRSTAVKAIQTANGIAVTGTTDASTWAAALKLPFTRVDWTARPPPRPRRPRRPRTVARPSRARRLGRAVGSGKMVAMSAVSPTYRFAMAACSPAVQLVGPPGGLRARAPADRRARRCWPATTTATGTRSRSASPASPAARSARWRSPRCGSPASARSSTAWARSRSSAARATPTRWTARSRSCAPALHRRLPRGHPLAGPRAARPQRLRPPRRRRPRGADRLCTVPGTVDIPKFPRSRPHVARALLRAQGGGRLPGETRRALDPPAGRDPRAGADRPRGAQAAAAAEGRGLDRDLLRSAQRLLLPGARARS